MGEKPGHTPAEITKGQRLVRNATRAALTPILRQEEVLKDPDGLSNAEQLHREGYGIVVLINHFSRTDPIHAMRAVAGVNEFKDQEIVAPIAKHQAVPGLVSFSRKTGIRLHEVVTEQTMTRVLEKGNPQGLKQGEGLLGYIRDAAETLERGGIVVMAPQATRQSVLKFDPSKQAVRGLLFGARNNPNIGIHFVAFGIEGVSDYSKRRGLNIGTRYQVIYGPTFPLQVALENAGGLRNIDKWAFDELAKIVPTDYLPPEQRGPRLA